MTHFPPGTVVAISLGVAEHVGVATEKDTVISNSRRRGRVLEETYEEFSGGRPVYAKGYPGDLPPEKVLRRARGIMGERWNLFTNNCEHVVNKAHGLSPRSPQVRFAAVATAAVVLGVTLLVGRRRA
jgi:hypothetical protein